MPRSLAGFAQRVETFDRCRASFSAVMQQINSATSMGRLMLNVLRRQRSPLPLDWALQRQVVGGFEPDHIDATRQPVGLVDSDLAGPNPRKTGVLGGD